MLELGFMPVVPPNRTRLSPWEHDRELYRKRNEIERLFRRLKGFRHIFSRFDKLDVLFLALIHFALIIEALPGYPGHSNRKPSHRPQTVNAA